MTEEGLSRSLARYRVIAYVVGAVLAVLAFVAVPLEYAADRPALADIGWPVHGALYVFYFLAAVDLSLRAGWRWTRTLLVVLAGTIPVLTFVAERKVVRELQGSGSPPAV